MNEKFLGKYRNGTTRLKPWNYSWNGYYFITTCAKNRFDYFGRIVGGKMVLNKIGKIVNKYWSDIPNHFINVYIDEYIVMPNHIHGIC
ncbi:MAG TPA: hypothetical protein PK957_01875 [Candidatus Dojkabacteria bacterium]|nr:hypothetical protein [Candidatus Dojkabacteria bacterium]HQF36843.1 hypothetical protein [Candidatus Dojkabacteria bacterium]